MAESPSAITIRVDIDSAEIQSFVRNTVHRYSEWLDSEGLIVGTKESGDDRSHDVLVIDFFGSVDG